MATEHWPLPRHLRDPHGGTAYNAHMSQTQPLPAALARAGTPSRQEPQLSQLVEALLKSYDSDPRCTRVGRHFLPSREEIVDIMKLLLQLMFPGYHGRQDLTSDNVGYHVGVVLNVVQEKLCQQVALCLSYEDEACLDRPVDPEHARAEARRLTNTFLARLPAVRALLISDAQAAFEGDPAAVNLDEVILAYPGFLAITVQRLAHELHILGIKLMPRIMTEWVHSKTGADIHPGASIGPSFFLDHATGAVIGETSELGSHVKLYQGVTLGAVSHPKDESGRVIRGTKRHPTVEDGVTIYANATVLGGNTVVGKGALVGGSVFLTQSVPPGARVAIKPPELQMKTPGAKEE